MIAPCPGLCIDSGLGATRRFYQGRFENAAVKGDYVAAFIDYVGLELLIPQDSGDLGVEVAMAAILGGKLAKLLNKRAGDLITGTLRRSKSYRSEVEDLTYGEIVELARGKGRRAARAEGGFTGRLRRVLKPTPPDR
jgi:hypothetical protein